MASHLEQHSPLKEHSPLERRRRAIADALRAVMAEPLPRPHPLPRQHPPTHHKPLERQQPREADQAPPASAATGSDGPGTASGLPSVRDALTAHIDWDEAEDLLSDGDSPVVPPLEVVGSMSRTASMALFGHA